MIAASSRGSGVLQFCVGQLLPGLIEYIAVAAEHEYPIGDPKLLTLTEALKSFVGVLGNVAVEHRQCFFSFQLFIQKFLTTFVSI